MAGHGFDLILLGRSRGRGEGLRDSLARKYATGRFQFTSCDLSSLATVRVAAESIRQDYPRIDVLINNAGSRFDTYSQSVDGFELTLATNHLGHFLLTSLLLERLLAAPQARIATLSSRRHRSVSKPDSWLTARESFERWEVYSRSKLANTLFASELARRLKDSPAVSNTVDPGIVASRFARNNGIIAWMKHIIPSFIQRQLVSCARAAKTVVYAATSPEVAGKTGRYFFEKQEITPSQLALDAGLAASIRAAFEGREDDDGDDDDDLEGPDVLRVRLSAATARSFVERAARVVASGRPPCPMCGQPLDPQGHICPRRNGHYVN
jgi:NAD(P)-dependent dehydrogenase (short-subunit alcohol dehydrogenase family)